jgi:pimeloyl-ACP methyl ester carboxylesterase
MQHLRTDLLDIAYEIGGPDDGPALMLLHGWPDDIRAWHKVAPRLHEAGFRTITPLVPMAHVRRGWRRGSPPGSEELCPDPMGHLESTGLVRGRRLR